MKRAVAYCRFSSDNQREESITAQYRAIQKYCEDNNIKLIKLYKDEAFSAKTDDRPSFLEMMKDVETQLFDFVIVHKLDRFARNRYDSAVYKRKLSKNNVRLISVLENIDGSPESIILESMLEGMNEYYSANLSREVTKGMKENAYQCKFNGGTVPLGYDIVNQHYKINNEEADLVRYIYDLYIDGHSTSRIAKILNSNGYRTKRNKKFNHRSFVTLLKNKLYYGTYTFTIKGEKIEIEDGVPAIITKEKYMKAQNRKDKVNYSFNESDDNYNYLLTNLLEYNGERMVGQSGTGKSGKVYHYYRSKHSKNKYLRADKVEPIMIEFVTKILFHEANIERLINRIYDTVIELSSYGDVDVLESKIKEIDRKINNLLKVLSSGVTSYTIIEELKKLESLKDDYELQIDNIKLNQNITVEDIREQMYRYRDNLDSEFDLKIIMHHLIDKIVLNEDSSYKITLKNVGSHEKFMVVDRLHSMNKIIFLKDYIKLNLVA